MLFMMFCFLWLGPLNKVQTRIFMAHPLADFDVSIGEIPFNHTDATMCQEYGVYRTKQVGMLGCCKQLMIAV